ncbi:MAG TPA: HD domain-containing protein [Niabella sp.]|nr:HD domain-containing protein [Niabella sp.]HOZ96579.1 HD domain-containing protein [Niabella sp.]HQW13240.1 HD domain-containing protein [Niabella sp.]HQX18720.1 HD domain-containing protein [Niabella sp.]HQX41860.1 HD domain-containing protein [Niabella sp.]
MEKRLGGSDQSLGVLASVPGLSYKLIKPLMIHISKGRLLVSLILSLPGMDIQLKPQEKYIIDKVSEAAQELGLESYLVGGFVRDKLLGRVSKDADIVCVGDGIDLAHAVAKKFNPVPQVNFFKNFGTAHIHITFKNSAPFDIEFVGARKESYQRDSRKPQVEPGSLQDDQKRRDFTINALAISLNKEDFGKMIDPFEGIKDLSEKIIITPLEPEQTFSDDPLRMMRAIRFATQLNFTIASTTLLAISEQAERIRIISQERITDELNKIILSEKPSIGFDLLYKTGLLGFIFPKMVALAGAEYKDGLGHKDNFYHTLQVLDNVATKSEDLWLRWAAILHDIAKPATKKFEDGHGWTFHGHEVVGGRMVPKIFNELKLPTNEKMRFVKKLVELHLRPISLTKENITDSAIRRILFDAGEDFEALMMLCEADITSKNKQKVKRFLENFQMVRERSREVEEKDQIRSWQPPIDGVEIMQIFNLQPSKFVGILKDSLKDAILDGEIENTKEAALLFLKQKALEIKLL